MREIAQRAGVSSATVSRVINGSAAVNEETAQRVRAVLDAVNFIPNPSATTLKYGRSKTFGVVVPDLSNPFFSEFLVNVEDELVQIDHELLLTSVRDEEGLVRSIRRMLMRQVDGAVLMGSEYETQAIEPLLLRRISLVTIDRRVTQAGCSDVAIHHEAGFLQAVAHLKALGHRRIGYVGGISGMQTSTLRAEAFRHAIREAGLAYHEDLVREGDYRIGGGEAAARSLMQIADPPTALLHANDMTAFGTALGIHRLGLRVPDDVSLVGFDDISLAQVAYPPLTTIRIPIRELARSCIKALERTKQENCDTPGRQFSVPTQLVVRESTAPPRKTKRKAPSSRSSSI